MSLRLALALGLHLRNENPNASTSDKEALVRLWWTLHAIESLISTITGRPPILAVEDSTVPLPQSLTEFPSTTTPRSSRRTSKHGSPEVHMSAQSTSDPQSSPIQGHQFLIDHVNLMRILQKALTELYSPRTAAQSWQVSQLCPYLHVRRESIQCQQRWPSLYNHLYSWLTPGVSDHPEKHVTIAQNA